MKPIDSSTAGTIRLGAAGIAQSGARILALDGVRGVAILMVLGHHFFAHTPASLSWLSALYRQLGQGWAGVDLFFVLSGFLITRILIRTRDNAHYFRDFFVRRSLRIFPLYYVVLGVIFLLLLPLGWVERTAVPAPSPMWLWLYLTNIVICLRKTLDFGVLHVPLTHLWSLAVEEHFYLVWPLLVWVIPSRWLLRACVALALTVVAARSVYVFLTHDWMAPYFLSCFRADSLLVGGVVAIFEQRVSDRARLRRIMWFLFLASAGSLLALKISGLASFGRDGVFMQTVGYTCLAVTFGALVGCVAFARIDDRLAVLFENSVLRFLGRHSYAIYLLHPICMVMIWNYEPQVSSVMSTFGAEAFVVVALAVATTAACASIAYATWYIVENPFLKMKSRFGAG